MENGSVYNLAKNSFDALIGYIKKSGFKGADPYDGLNSKVFKNSPFYKSKTCRLIWIQLFRRSPINLRGITGVPKEHNPKGLGLFLSGYCSLWSTQKDPEHLEKIKSLLKTIISLRSSHSEKVSWGYNFDWQSRTFFIPNPTPNVIVSTFIANALLDTYQAVEEDQALTLAKGVGDFILSELNRTYDADGDFCFSYTPIDKSAIFNASLLASSFLARLYSFTKDERLLEDARKSINFCIKRQREDGSWFYGVDKNQEWIDSFHTGYNLEALYDYQKYTGDSQYQQALDKGFKFYLGHFFTDEGIPKYYHDKNYPIDIHSVSQLLVLAAKMPDFGEHIKLVENVLKWTVENMQDKKEGHFYYQKKRFSTIKIPYLRWSQSWMFYALSVFLSSFKEENRS